ncbi:MAG: hypothetical protein ABIG95_00360 [Candidatus Woesearchaeota archaeon]
MGVDIRITYETLFDMLRNEKNHEELQKLESTFFEDLVAYIKDKKNLTNKPDKQLFSNLEQEKARKQLENINRLIKELYERREKKIINMALIRSRTTSIIDESALLTQEKELFDAINQALDKGRGRMLVRLLEAELPISEQQKKPEPIVEENKVLIRFLQPVPQFVGKNLEVYGPFEEEDLAKIPAELANILLKKGKAEQIG